MALLSLANVSLSIGDRPLLQEVNLSVEPGEHVGLIGRNGCGKSTLLRIIAGQGPFKPDSGQVQLSNGAVAGYLAQDPNLNPDMTLRQAAQTALAHVDRLQQQLHEAAHEMATAQEPELGKLLARYEALEIELQAAGGYAIDHRIDATLHGVGLTDEFFHVRVADLSGGQKGRLALARLLLTGPDLLLLDEPTNHLDIVGRQWLEQYLAECPSAVIVVSHDRWLLDRVAKRIYELEDDGTGGRLIEYPGNYQAYRVQRQQRRLAQQRVYDKQQERIRSEQAFIDRYRAGQRARQAQGREKRLERYQRDETIDRPVEAGELSMRFNPGQRCGDLVATADRLSKAYGQKVLFRDLSLVIKRGDRVGIIGPNGAGKSTLVHALLGLTPVDSGSARVGNSVNLGFYRQTHEHLDQSLTVVEHLRQFVNKGRGGPGADQAARDLAGAFLFTGDDQDKTLGVLSGGERSRAVLAGLMAGGHNVLVLDEPTNHLDIPSAERLEEALKQFTAPQEGYGDQQQGGGTLILVTHDRQFLESLCDQLIVVDGAGNVGHVMRRYSEYAAGQTAAGGAAGRAGATGDSNASGSGRKTRTQGGADSGAASGGQSAGRQKAGEERAGQKGQGRKQKSRGSNSALAHLEQSQLEKKIMDLESQLAAVDAQLADPDLYHDGEKVRKTRDRRAELTRQLEPLEEEWSRRAADE